MTEIQATYIPKGKIVPNWILRFKNKKRQKHKIKSNGFYVARHKQGALYIWPDADSNYIMTISNIKKIHIQIAPYSKYGSAIFDCKSAAIAALSKPVIDSHGKTTKLPNSPKEKELAND